MDKFFKLSKTSTIFFDTASRLKVTASVPGRLASAKLTNKVKGAIKNGHILEISESEFLKSNTFSKKEEVEEKEEVDFSIMSKTDILDFMEVNYPEEFKKRETELVDMKKSKLTEMSQNF